MTLLTELKPSLPSTWYYDPDHYALELRAVWYRDWVCIGRLEDVPEKGDYRVVELGDQRLIVTRNGDGKVNVFHNTCRHRGSALCTSDAGRFRNGRIICPYHTWTYSLDGDLVATPSRAETDDFHAEEFSLYAVHSDAWGGYLFINLSTAPEHSLLEFLGDEVQRVNNWPLADMVSVHQERADLACNWKVFWENYNECYHCPRMHPELCRLVPVYKKGLISRSDDPDWSPESADDDGEPHVAAGNATWTLDGQTILPPIPGPTDAERNIGMTFASFTASMFVVAHTDYVRSVRLLPTGPESVTLIVDWLLLPGVYESHKDEMEKTLQLGRLVVEQDGRACELNQEGLRSSRHQTGVLVAQEYWLWEFHEWLRDRLREEQAA
ncbi:MAG: aromatic ring-hydroxylating dioxygenase subunit alpha [Gammaproteobacteria bacterium]|nr:aromatic ring-hydroxylating dioxygenase subunit alpha [Gammaproteobacteria bacterium]